MKSLNKIILIITLVVLALLALPGTAQAATPEDDKVIFGGTFTLESGETLDGNLAVFGGTATIEEGARVNGEVILTGGTVNVDGEVTGSLVLIGGAAFLGEDAVVHGDVNTLGAALHRASGARIEGEVISGSGRPFDFDIPRRVFVPGARINFDPFWDLMGFFARTLAMAALAIVIVLVAPNATNRTALAAASQPVVTGGLGLLTAVVAVPVLVILTITILLIPVSLMAAFVLIVAVLYGWIALGLEIGKRTAQLFKTEWPLPLAAGIGTFVLSLVTSAIGFIPCVGWLAPFLVGIVGLGAVLVTRFGTRAYPVFVATPSGPVPPVTPAAPVTPPVYPVSPEPPAPASRVEIYDAPESPSEPEDQSTTDTPQA